MRAKTLIELLTLSTNLYIISKDEEFMKNLSEMTKKGKEKVDDLISSFTEHGEEDHETIMEKFLEKTKQAKEELEKKIEETAAKVYHKMHIAHTDQVETLAAEIKLLRNELALAEARMVNLEGLKK